MLLALLTISVFFIFVYMCIIFVVACLKNDNSIVDSAWGLGFVFLSIVCLGYSHLFVFRVLLVTLLIALWGVRLSAHVLMRHWGKAEDSRYVELRKSWGDHPILYAFFQVFMLQGLLMLLIGYPIILVNSSYSGQFTWINYVGLCLWLVGFAFESIGDYQLYLFTQVEANKGKVMDQGLWRFTRHPNYFGEIAQWWGIFFITVTIPFGLSAVISPLLITYLLLRVSGIPLLEKQFDNNADYQKYKKKTSMLIPWFQKKD